jgi:hypothetical protein
VRIRFCDGGFCGGHVTRENGGFSWGLGLFDGGWGAVVGDTATFIHWRRHLGQGRVGDGDIVFTLINFDFKINQIAY